MMDNPCANGVIMWLNNMYENNQEVTGTRQSIFITLLLAWVTRNLYYQIPAKIILFMMVSFVEGILGSIMNLTGIYSVSSGELPSFYVAGMAGCFNCFINIIYDIYGT